MSSFKFIVIAFIAFIIFSIIFFKIKVFKEFTKGERTLAESYWGWLIFFPTISLFLLSLFLTFLAKLKLSLPIQFETALYFVLMFYLNYYFFALLGTWRSANKYIIEKNKLKLNAFFGWLAKTLIFLAGAYIPIFLVFIFHKINKSSQEDE